jgi:hypothetical protein
VCEDFIDHAHGRQPPVMVLALAAPEMALTLRVDQFSGNFLADNGLAPRRNF